MLQPRGQLVAAAELGVLGLEEPRSLLLCTSFQAQPPSPAASQLFVLVSLSCSLPPFLRYPLSSTSSPTISPSRFPPASPAPRLQLSAPQHFNAALSSLKLPGEVIERPEGRVPAPRAGAGTGCQRGCSCWGRGAGCQQRTWGRGLGLCCPELARFRWEIHPKASPAPKSPFRQVSRLCSKAAGHKHTHKKKPSKQHVAGI